MKGVGHVSPQRTRWMWEDRRCSSPGYRNRIVSTVHPRSPLVHPLPHHCSHPTELPSLLVSRRMPVMRIYDGEVRDLPRRSAGQSLSKFYDQTISCFSLGRYGEAELCASETVPKVTKQLIAAAVRAGVGVEIISTHRKTVFFKTVASTQCTLGI